MTTDEQSMEFITQDIHRCVKDLPADASILIIDDATLRDNDAVAYQVTAGRWTITVGVTHDFVDKIPVGMATASGIAGNRLTICKLPPESYEEIVKFLAAHVEDFPRPAEDRNPQ